MTPFTLKVVRVICVTLVEWVGTYLAVAPLTLFSPPIVADVLPEFIAFGVVVAKGRIFRNSLGFVVIAVALFYSDIFGMIPAYSVNSGIFQFVEKILYDGLQFCILSL